MTWADMERRKKAGRCQYLDPDGKRCRAPATWSDSFHQEHEIGSEWFVVFMCEAHMKHCRPHELWKATPTVPRERGKV